LAISRAIFITGLDCAEFGINAPKKYKYLQVLIYILNEVRILVQKNHKNKIFQNLLFATVLAMDSDSASEGMKGFPLAISLNANLLGNQKEGTLLAIASFVKKGKAVSVVRTVVSGADGKLIADVTTSHVLSQ
jgi:acyl-coenzyme A thioesterase PaaI-like protein